ncbi:MAG: hypothetical protein ABGX83_09265 [Nitrospira sp.]|nr:hypothetical protein [Candidatus Manganitrophaceae bacterium]HIL34359.1 hypothetical protein [Candidatus Manganitrophaceae bacterium]
MPNLKRVRIQVRTSQANYEGYITIPQMRKRISDVLNEEDRRFINLTDVLVDGKEESIPFVSVNKSMIESILECDE